MTESAGRQVSPPTWASWPAVCGEAALWHARTLLCCSWVLYEDPCGLWPDC
jgi:hypothetical protein